MQMCFMYLPADATRHVLDDKKHSINKMFRKAPNTEGSPSLGGLTEAEGVWDCPQLYWSGSLQPRTGGP